jgi:chromosome partitioning protein
MKESLDRSAKVYDYIFIDCPPSLNLITLNALVAAKAFGSFASRVLRA